MTAAGLKLPFRMASPNRSLVETLAPIGRVRTGDIEHTANKWSWDKFVLRSSRAISIVIFLTQAIAGFVLIARRRKVEDVTLLLDSANGLYAIIGILSTCNSLI